MKKTLAPRFLKIWQLFMTLGIIKVTSINRNVAILSPWWMADGLWLLTISYEPSAINYRLHIKIAFICCGVNIILCSSASTPAALHNTYPAGSEQEHTISKCLTEFDQGINQYPSSVSRPVNSHCLIGNGKVKSLRIKTAGSTLTPPTRLLFTTIVSRTRSKAEMQKSTKIYG